jgi:hypothetical protein
MALVTTLNASFVLAILGTLNGIKRVIESPLPLTVPENLSR